MSKTKTILASVLALLLTGLSTTCVMAAEGDTGDPFLEGGDHAAADEFLADVENLTATAIAEGVSLSWDAVENADSYTIYRGTTSVAEDAGEYDEQVVVDNITTYDITGLTPGTTYYFAIAAEDSTGTYKGSENYSGETSAVPLEAEPVVEDPIIEEDPTTEDDSSTVDESNDTGYDPSEFEDYAAAGSEGEYVNPEINEPTTEGSEDELPASGPGLALVLIASASGTYFWRKLRK